MHVHMWAHRECGGHREHAIIEARSSVGPVIGGPPSIDVRVMFSIHGTCLWFTPHNFFAFDDTPILIEDPEGNKVRSLQIHPLISVITTLPHRTPRTPFRRVSASMTPDAVSHPPLPLGLRPTRGSDHPGVRPYYSNIHNY